MKPLMLNIFMKFPLFFKKEGLDDLILKKLHIKREDKELTEWKNYVVKRLKSPAKEVKIAVVGKYIALPDAYKSIYEGPRSWRYR